MRIDVHAGPLHRAGCSVAESGKPIHGHSPVPLLRSSAEILPSSARFLMCFPFAQGSEQRAPGSNHGEVSDFLRCPQYL